MDTDLREFLVTDSLEGIILTDMEGNILECNGTTHRILGYPGTALEGQFIGIIFPPQSISYLLPNLLHLVRSGGGFNGEIILQSSKEDNVMVRMTAQAWPPENPSYLLIRFLDWSETNRIMTQLRESNQMASLGALTRSLSHEILNPVSIIGGHIRRLLASLPPDSREEEWARQVLFGTERLESMIGTIETFLSLPSPSFEKNSLENPLGSSLDRIQVEADRAGIRITREKGRDLPQIFMDPDLMEKAFSAVLLNAVDRMPKGGELILGLSYGDGLCRVSIEDNGPTLDASQMEEDLSPIHMIGAHRTHLNLAIAKRIVDEHGGRFDIGTSASKGLKVRIGLPTDRRALAREREM